MVNKAPDNKIQQNQYIMQYDLFISYSREDNLTNRVTELKEKIEADYLEFAKEELKCFFDKHEIKGMEDWKQRLLQGLKDSYLLLLILSPNYLESSYCEWEIVEYLKYEYARAIQGDGVAQIYFIEIPDLDGPGFAEKAKAWIEKVSRRQRFDFRPWYNDGVDSLKYADVKTRLEELKKSLLDRILRMRRIANAIGNLPAPNVRFVGREREMKLLHESVGLGKFGVLTAVHGMGGLGKTAIAFQYAYAYADFYAGGRWQIGCANETNLASVLKKLDLDLKVTFTEDEKKDDIRGAKRILNELETLAFKGSENALGEKKSSNPAVLLLLDNVDHAGLIQPPNSDLISGKKWLKVLVTTRMGPEELGNDETKQTLLTIDELPFSDALSLLESYQPNGRFKNEDEQEKAGEIVKLLGCFTLAVEVAALYLYECKRRVSCAAFLELLKREGGVTGVDIVGANTSMAISHGKLVSATLAPTLDILSLEETLILNYASLLPPDSIPIPWLRALVIKEFPELELDALPGLDDPWLSVINHLLSLRLLQVVDLDVDQLTPQIVRMHRIVQETMNMRCSNNDEHLSKLCNLCIDRSEYLETHWHLRSEQWEINPLFIFTESLLDKGHLFATRMVKYLGQWLPYNFSWNQSELIYRKAINILEMNPIADSKETAIILSNLGLILRWEGRFKEAEVCIRKALEIDEKERDSKHPFIAIRLDNLAGILKDTNRLIEAEPLYRRAIQIYETNYGQDCFESAYSLGNLASLFREIYHLDEAELLYLRTIRITEKYLGSEHPHLGVMLSGYGATLYCKGQQSKAKDFIQRALVIMNKSLSPDHPLIAGALNNLAAVEQKLGNLKEAELLFCKALAIWEKSLPPGHIDTQNSYNNLAALFEKTGRNKEAKELRLRSLEHETYEITPLKLRIRALEYLKLADYTNAEKLLNRVLVEKFEIPGTHCHLARIYILTDRLSEAEEHVELACQHRTEAPVYVTARIIWFKIALRFLKKTNIENLIDKLKAVISKEGVFMVWTMKPVLDHIKPQITEQQHAFLSAIIDALNDKKYLERLNNFEEWRDAKPEELD